MDKRTDTTATGHAGVDFRLHNPHFDTIHQKRLIYNAKTHMALKFAIIGGAFGARRFAPVANYSNHLADNAR